MLPGMAKLLLARQADTRISCVMNSQRSNALLDVKLGLRRALVSVVRRLAALHRGTLQQ